MGLVLSISWTDREIALGLEKEYAPVASSMLGEFMQGVWAVDRLLSSELNLQHVSAIRSCIVDR